jgi:protein disulfide-isomerase
MKGYSLLVTLLVFATAAFQTNAYAAEPHRGIAWQTNYQQALQESRNTSKPILLFFTGSDWCGWCTKLEQEVFATPEFAQNIGNKLIFVMLDFPMKKSLDARTHQQNENLKKRFSIRSYPTVILINSEEELIGTTGYRAGGGQKYAQYLLKMINEFSTYKQKMKQLPTQAYLGKDLKRLFQKANELGLEEDANRIVDKGINSDLSHFFLAERYRTLIKTGRYHTQEAAAIKQRLLASDPSNSHLTHYQVAVIDFEFLNMELDRKKLNVETAVRPLTAYIEQFGENDHENIWRLNMVISQVYLDENKLKKALQYAQNSYNTAPTSIQQEIAQSINKIETQISKEN